MPNGYLENQKVELLLKEYPKKLAHIYYKFDKISFSDDILLELGISPNHLINKPSVNNEHNKTIAIDYFMGKLREVKNENPNEYIGILNKKRGCKKSESKSIVNNIEINLNRKFILKNKNKTT